MKLHDARLWTWLALTPACTQEIRIFERAASDAAWPDAGAVPPRDAGDDPHDGGHLRPIVVAAGLSHTCAIVDGSLYCWGDGAYGKLGQGDTASRDVPTRVGEADHWVAVCAGEEHSCALSGTGEISCFGGNLRGELGLGNFTQRLSPRPIVGLRARAVACGGLNTCALAFDGSLFCWGDNFEGKLGQGDAFDSADIPTPVRVKTDRRFREVGVGQGHVCAIDNGGTLYCWGRNSDGQLGIDTLEPQLRSPQRVSGGGTYREVAAGQRHTCAIKQDGSLFCWGTDSQGSLGLDVAGETTRLAPQRVEIAGTVQHIDLKWFHTCVVRDAGQLLCWGRGDEGQLGLGDLADRAVPTRVGQRSGYDSLATGSFHTCASRGAALYCWGDNTDHGQLGLGDRERRARPTLVAFPESLIREAPSGL